MPSCPLQAGRPAAHMAVLLQAGLSIMIMPVLTCYLCCFLGDPDPVSARGEQGQRGRGISSRPPQHAEGALPTP
jgi:hypothetical protein